MSAILSSLYRLVSGEAPIISNDAHQNVHSNWTSTTTKITIYSASVFACIASLYCLPLVPALIVDAGIIYLAYSALSHLHEPTESSGPSRFGRAFSSPSIHTQYTQTRSCRPDYRTRLLDNRTEKNNNEHIGFDTKTSLPRASRGETGSIFGSREQGRRSNLAHTTTSSNVFSPSDMFVDDAILFPPSSTPYSSSSSWPSTPSRSQRRGDRDRNDVPTGFDPPVRTSTTTTTMVSPWPDTSTSYTSSSQLDGRGRGRSNVPTSFDPPVVPSTTTTTTTTTSPWPPTSRSTSSLPLDGGDRDRSDVLTNFVRSSLGRFMTGMPNFPSASSSPMATRTVTSVPPPPTRASTLDSGSGRSDVTTSFTSVTSSTSFSGPNGLGSRGPGRGS